MPTDPSAPSSDVRSTADVHRQLLVELASIAGTAEDAADLAARSLAAITEALQAVTGFIALAEPTEEGVPRLVPAAMMGPHATLLGAALTIDSDSDADVARAYRTGDAHYVESAFGEGRAEGALGGAANGAARWRDQVSAQATAVVPIGLEAGRLGALLLEWSSPQDFDEPTREVLEGVTLVIALGLSRLQSAEEAGAFVVAQSAEEGLRFELTAEGVVLTHDERDAWDAGRIRGVVTFVDPTAAMVVDAYSPAPGRVLMVVGAVSGLGGVSGSELAEVLRQTARVLAAEGDFDRLAQSLEQRVRHLAAPSVHLNAWVALWRPGFGALDHTLVGTAGARMLMADGRDVHAGGAPAAETWLPLSGDIVHAWVPGVVSARIEWV